MTVQYLHLPIGLQPPPVDGVGPFKAVLVLQEAVADEWQDRVSEYLVRSGCLYMMAWGVRCVSWDDSVDWANHIVTGLDNIPDDQFVMTTWHKNEPLSDTFWYAGHSAHHPTVSLDRVVIIDIGPANRETEMLRGYEAAQSLYA